MICWNVERKTEERTGLIAKWGSEHGKNMSDDVIKKPWNCYKTMNWNECVTGFT